MDILAKVSEVLGTKFEDLHPDEREVVRGWIATIEAKEITLDGVKAFVSNWRKSVDILLATENLPKNQDLFLKARLKNLIALEGFLEGPEQAKKSLELYLNKLKK